MISVYEICRSMLARLLCLATLTIFIVVAGVADGQQPTSPANRPQQRPAPEQVRQPGQQVQQPAAGAEKRLAVPPQLPKRFRLTAQQDEYVYRVLVAWQKHADTTVTFKSKFTRWSYDPTFQKDKPMSVSEGNLKFKDPDKGTFRVTKIMNLNTTTGKYEPSKNEYGEHWVCDGESIWEVNHEDEAVVEQKIPEHLQGEQISSTPLPFLFGSQAKDLKNRYFLCIVTPREYAENEIWVDAIPRTRADAANFQEAILRLNRKNFNPIALRIYEPGPGYSTYEFSSIEVNPRFEAIRKLFAPPAIPPGYKKVLEVPPEATARRPSK